MLRLNVYEVSDENLERKVSKKDVIMKEMTMSVKQMNCKLSSEAKEKQLLEKANEGLMKTYIEQHTKVGASVGKL